MSVEIQPWMQFESRQHDSFRFLSPGEIHIFRGDLNLPEILVPHAVAWLDNSEIHRSVQYACPKESNRFVFGQALLRALFSRYLNKSPEKVRFSPTNEGKPFLLGGENLKFNLSHSEELFILAISKKIDLGIDVEKSRSIRYLDDVISYSFSRSEISELMATEDSEKQRRFFRTWVRKEAVVKAIGKTVAEYMDRFDVPTCLNPGIWPVAVQTAEKLNGKNMTFSGFLYDISIKKDIPAALCSTIEPRIIKRFRLSRKAISSLLKNHIE